MARDPKASRAARRRIAVGVALALAMFASPAFAYIGPGAGFAVVGATMVLLTTLVLVVFTLLTWPFTVVYRALRIGNPYKHALAQRVIVLGLDGMDPGLALKWMREGRLPNFQKLAEQGVFRPLDTSNPSISPVAWSTFSTGVDASRHAIYDFLTRDPCTYGPLLSSTDIRAAKRVANIGRYVVPLSKPRIKLLQKSQAFWKLLGDRHIFSIIQRVPITFPPVPFRGLLLSGMCVPDLRGSQGTFSFFSTKQDEHGHPTHTGGEQTVLRRQGDRMRTRLVGPDNSLLRSGGRMTLPMTITVAADRTGVRIEIDGSEPFDLPLRTYSPWIRLCFQPGLHVKVYGIARFYLNSVEPEVELYVTPIHIDPENPAMPISHPSIYSVYLAKKQGPFATLGLAEDTWALNERVIDEKAFFEQAMAIYEERERMFLDALAQTKRGLVTTVFDTTDRVQHMFYRYLDPSHPANAGKDTTEWKDAIARVYERLDALLGRIWSEALRSDTVLLVISDHGFTNFRRGVNLNTWLYQNGYLALKDGHTTSGDWFEHVDWTKTRAFSLGLTGMFVNRQGREQSGIVREGDEYRKLCAELAAKLEALVDPETGRRAIRKVRATNETFDGPYRLDAPDLLIGYDGGYRNSWECATGAVTASVFSDNTRSWSGDHCVDPEIVPGVLFCNRRIATERPRLIDIPVSIVELFGQKRARHMQGEMIFGADAQVAGGFDAERLEQSGAAPGARVTREKDAA
ncbi:MAG TPA: alkaline phosphatase family protein [Myxococcota bacterium]|nr:alkaline phosphatase family protein [Myxococcota bacterium]